MTEDTALKLIKLILAAMVVQIFVIGFVLYQSYAGRVQLVKTQRAGCARGKLDRVANASGWRFAEKARRDAGEITVANHYANLASGLEKRSRIDCQTAFPNASLLP